MAIRRKAFMVMMFLFLAMGMLVLTKNSYAAGSWCPGRHCTTTRTTHYQGCRKIVRMRQCFNRGGFRHCRIVRTVRWVC